jgi:sigma-B regulation protein RsbU (phosphoserine phosphatase)
MIQPKELYRKLAMLLAEIDEGRDKEDYLLSVLATLENSFIRDLHITDGRLYAEDQERFLPMNVVDGGKHVRVADKRALDSEAARLVVENGTYIYNDPSMTINKQTSLQGKHGAPAAFIVKDPNRQWIFTFALESGWVRDEVEFCLNAIRAQLNFQLHIDAMKSDVQQASIIQQSLLPNSPPFIAGYEISARSQPAEVVGGDFFDFSIFDEKVFSVAVGDASGHGLPAALLVRDVVTGLRMGVEKEMKMAEAMRKLNRVIHRSTLSTNFVSLFFAEIESTGNVFYVNAGHPPPILVHGSAVKRLESTGMILGAVPDVEFHRASASFEPGAVLVMYSDGVLERQNGNEEFGLARLEELVIRHQQESASAILNAIFQTILAFGDQSRWQDDVTVVVIKKVA